MTLINNINKILHYWHYPCGVPLSCILKLTLGRKYNGIVLSLLIWGWKTNNNKNTILFVQMYNEIIFPLLFRGWKKNKAAKI